MMHKKEAEDILAGKSFLSKGKRGMCYVSRIKNKTYLIKMRNPCSEAARRIENEAKYDALLAKKGVAPKIHYNDDKKEFLIREFIDGINIEKWMLANRNGISFKRTLRTVFLRILDDCRTMDEMGINKQEMGNPHKDIIIDGKNHPHLIDFERCSDSNNPKNVTQFCQYISSEKTAAQSGLGRIVAKKDIILLCKQYRRDMSKKNYGRIREFVEKSFSSSSSSS